MDPSQNGPPPDPRKKREELALQIQTSSRPLNPRALPWFPPSPASRILIPEKAQPQIAEWPMNMTPAQPSTHSSTNYIQLYQPPPRNSTQFHPPPVNQPVPYHQRTQPYNSFPPPAFQILTRTNNTSSRDLSSHFNIHQEVTYPNHLRNAASNFGLRAWPLALLPSLQDPKNSGYQPIPSSIGPRPITSSYIPTTNTLQRLANEVGMNVNINQGDNYGAGTSNQNYDSRSPFGISTRIQRGLGITRGYEYGGAEASSKGPDYEFGMQAGYGYGMNENGENKPGMNGWYWWYDYGTNTWNPSHGFGMQGHELGYWLRAGSGTFQTTAQDMGMMNGYDNNYPSRTPRTIPPIRGADHSRNTQAPYPQTQTHYRQTHQIRAHRGAGRQQNIRPHWQQSTWTSGQVPDPSTSDLNQNQNQNHAWRGRGRGRRPYWPPRRQNRGRQITARLSTPVLPNEIQNRNQNHSSFGPGRRHYYRPQRQIIPAHGSTLTRTQVHAPSAPQPAPTSPHLADWFRNIIFSVQNLRIQPNPSQQLLSQTQNPRAGNQNSSSHPQTHPQTETQTQNRQPRSPRSESLTSESRQRLDFDIKLDPSQAQPQPQPQPPNPQSPASPSPATRQGLNQDLGALAPQHQPHPPQTQTQTQPQAPSEVQQPAQQFPLTVIGPSSRTNPSFSVTRVGIQNASWGLRVDTRGFGRDLGDGDEGEDEHDGDGDDEDGEDEDGDDSEDRQDEDDSSNLPSPKTPENISIWEENTEEREGEGEDDQDNKGEGEGEGENQDKDSDEGNSGNGHDEDEEHEWTRDTKRRGLRARTRGHKWSRWNGRERTRLEGWQRARR